jgi:hypothetical protein
MEVTNNDEMYLDEGSLTDSVGESQAYNFNPDPKWQEHALTYERMIQKISTKYCSADDSLREDVMQEARVAIACTRPEDCEGFEQYVRGELTDLQWQKALKRYIHNIIRNSILSYLDSYPKGNWYIGRTRSMKDKKTGESRKVYLPPRYSSLDFLVDEHGMQVDEHGNISWPNPGDDGLLVGETQPGTVAKHYGTRKWWTPAMEDLDTYAPKDTEVLDG